MAKISTDEYLLKLVPSFTVFNIVEKYAIDNNKSGTFGKDDASDIFYYGAYVANTELSLYRAMFKILDTDNSEILPNDDTYFKKILANGEIIYIISSDKPISFNSNCTMIGVGY